MPDATAFLKFVEQDLNLGSLPNEDSTDGMDFTDPSKPMFDFGQEIADAFSSETPEALESMFHGFYQELVDGYTPYIHALLDSSPDKVDSFLLKTEVLQLEVIAGILSKYYCAVDGKVFNIQQMVIQIAKIVHLTMQASDEDDDDEELEPCE